MVHEGSLGFAVRARDLLRIANALRFPRAVLVSAAGQLDAVDAGKPFGGKRAIDPLERYDQGSNTGLGGIGDRVGSRGRQARQAGETKK